MIIKGYLQMEQQSENIDIPETEEYKNDLFLLIDFLQEKVTKLEAKIKGVVKEKVNKLKAKEKEVVKLKKKLHYFDFERRINIDLLNQLNHLQNLMLEKSKDYDKIKLQHKSLIKEVEIIYETLNTYKNLSIEQNKQILRAINLIKKKNI